MPRERRAPRPRMDERCPQRRGSTRVTMVTIRWVDGYSTCVLPVNILRTGGKTAFTCLNAKLDAKVGIINNAAAMREWRNWPTRKT
jgi:hypothetical protein